MNWKIVVGIAVGIALIAIGAVAVHSGVMKNISSATSLDNGFSDGSPEGPHPPSAPGWGIIASTEGPHPPSAPGWGQ